MQLRTELLGRWYKLVDAIKVGLGWPVYIWTMEQFNSYPDSYREIFEQMSEEALREYNLYRCKDCEDLYPIEVTDYRNDPENYYMGDGDQFATDGNEKVGLWCENCESSFHEYGNTILVVIGEEVSKLTENSGIFWDWGAYGEHPSLPAYMQRTIMELNPHYHRVDGWRGYDVFDTPSGYVNVRTGWVGWGSSSDFHDIMEQVRDGQHNLPFPVIVVIAKTSNVFSVNIDVYVPEENEKDFERLFTKEEHVDFDSADEIEVDEVTAMVAAMKLPMAGKKVEHIEDLGEGRVKIRVKQKSMDVWKPEKKEDA